MCGVPPGVLCVGVGVILVCHVEVAVIVCEGVVCMCCACLWCMYCVVCG